jgi:hypothetical protein
MRSVLNCHNVAKHDKLRLRELWGSATSMSQRDVRLREPVFEIILCEESN